MNEYFVFVLCMITARLFTELVWFSATQRVCIGLSASISWRHHGAPIAQRPSGDPKAHDDVMMWKRFCLLGNPSETGGFLAQRASNAEIWRFFGVSLNGRLNNQSSFWLNETPQCSRDVTLNGSETIRTISNAHYPWWWSQESSIYLLVMVQNHCTNKAKLSTIMF